MSVDAAGRIDELRLKAERAPIRDEADFDWDRPARPPPWMTERMAIWLLSQFLRGEAAAARMCAAIGGGVDGSAARGFLETQHRDELRHARILSRYLGKLGPEAAPAPELERCYAEALGWRGAPQAVMLAFHIVLEGENLRLQSNVEMWMPCPLFGAISDAIAQDEARHVAFGKLYLRETLPDLPRRERLGIYLWLRGLWMSGAGVVAGRIMPPGALGGGALDGFIAARWAERLRDLEAAGLFSAEERPLFAAA